MTGRVDIAGDPLATHRISPLLHSVFGEYFGNVIYDGTWVGPRSEIPNIDGLRRDVVEGFRQAGVAGIRWPGGACADHYHWKEGIGASRRDRIHPRPRPPSRTNWRHDFGTDELLNLARLTGAEPIIVANVATGTAEEFLDWYEYCNGDATTKWGAQRAANGHTEPYGVTHWGMGNTDENAWIVAFNDPVAYARAYLTWRAAVLELPARFIALGLSERHNTPNWVERFLDYVTHNRSSATLAPQSLSIHHYSGGMKGRYQACEGALDYSDAAYYFTLRSVAAYQSDIDLHRRHITEHTPPGTRITLSFDEWGLWHPEATDVAGNRQPQTMRDALFAARSLHTFYRNADIVEYAMATQWSNLLQSLFETDGARFYRTPTFFVFRLFKDHLGQNVVPLAGIEGDDMLDCVCSRSADGGKLTLSFINLDLQQPRTIALGEQIASDWQPEECRAIAPDAVRARNSFAAGELIHDRHLSVSDGTFTLAPHSVARLILSRASGVVAADRPA